MTHRAQSLAGFSGSSSSSKELDIVDDRMTAVVLSEEYAKLDGAAARRLSHLSAIPVRSLIILNESLIYKYIYIYKGALSKSQNLYFLHLVC